VVGDVCGVHAQLISAAELSIAVRVDVGRSRMREMIWGGRVLAKSYGPRGTVHLFPAAELPLWMAARRGRSILDPRSEQARLQQVGVERGQLEELVKAIGEALDGRVLTLRELGEEVVCRTGPWAGQVANDAWGTGWPSWRRALGFAATAGVLCFGPNRDNQVTFVRPQQWLGSWQDVDPEQALLEVFRRFLRAYGPASPGHFGQWFGLSALAARQLASSLGPELAEVSVEGEPLLVLADGAAGLEAGGGSVRLLPYFDCYLRGFYPRSQLTGGHAVRAAGGTGRFPVLLVDGQVAGVWERRTRGRRVEVRLDAFRRLDRRASREVESEAARIAAFDGREVDVVRAPVEVRAHL
jgi:hypothetical protein